MVAERMGFEPMVPGKGHALSRRAYSSALAPLHEAKPNPSSVPPRRLLGDGRSLEVRPAPLSAERAGFEPAMRLLPYVFSRHAP